MEVNAEMDDVYDFTQTLSDRWHMTSNEFWYDDDDYYY